LQFPTAGNRLKFGLDVVHFAFDSAEPSWQLDCDREAAKERHGDADQLRCNPVAKPEWGAKRLCPSCGAKFYDLQRKNAVCPKCSTPVEPEPAAKPRRTPVEATPAPEVAKLPADIEDQQPAESSDDNALKALGVEDDDSDDDDDNADLIEDATELGEDADDMSEVVSTSHGDEAP